MSNIDMDTSYICHDLLSL